MRRLGATTAVCAALRQRGVALITALLVMALATTAAVALAAHLHLDIRRTGNVLETDQAYVYALGIETLGEQFLSQYAKRNRYDAEADLAKAAVVYPVEGGMVQGQLQDMEARFNLNSLVDNNGKVDADAVTRFRNLLSVLGLNFGLADAVVDWIDPDTNVSFPDGAEDYDYLSLDPPYRAANRRMASPTELLLVKGFTRAVLYGDANKEGLLKYVAALPQASTTINVNTVSPVVLQALSPKISPTIADTIVDLRKQTPFKTLNDFFDLPQVASAQVDRAKMGPLDVQSSYFLVDANVSVGRGRMQLASLVYRTTNGKTVVVARSQGTAGVY